MERNEIEAILPELKAGNLKLPIHVDIRSLQALARKVTNTDIQLKNYMDVEAFIKKGQTRELRDLLKQLLQGQHIHINEVELNKRLVGKGKVLDFFNQVFLLTYKGKPLVPEGRKPAGEARSQQPAAKPEKPPVEEEMAAHVQAEPLPDLAAAYDIIMQQPAKQLEVQVELKPIELMDSLPVDATDNIAIRISAGADSFRDCLILFSPQDKEVVAVGRMVAQGNSKCLVMDSSHIDYELAKKREVYSVALLPADGSKGYYVAQSQARLIWKPLTQSGVLCIDFGTSNTTAGSYGIKDPKGTAPEIVEFVDVTEAAGEMKLVDTLPTTVYIESCTNNHPVYKFGYEAQRELIRNDFCPKGSYFSEIKRWITSMEDMEKVHGGDADGSTMEISHRDIIAAYIRHVIDLSQRYFKIRFQELHFSAPVKLKDTFVSEMTQILQPDGYKVWEAGECLDEAVAVLYNAIRHDKDKDQEKRKLVFDCGGGTTDLAQCKYTIGQDAFGDTGDMKIGYVNGDSNYGGNNITYRIMQILKIKLAAKITGKPEISKDILSLITQSDEEILTQIDDDGAHGRDEIYQGFQDMYKAVNKYIPTDYDEAKDFGSDLQRKKRNFYYLWDIAESLKLEFHNSTNRVQLNFGDDEDKKLCLRSDKQYYIYVRKEEGQPLERLENPADDLDITIKEISKAILPDLYSLLNNVLPKDANGNVPQDTTTTYKFTGQSCRISMFKDLFKEFVPGRRLRNSSKDNSQQQSIVKQYKLPCLLGCISYVADKRKDQYQLTMDYEKSPIRYTVEDVSKQKSLLSAEKLDVTIARYRPGEVMLRVWDVQGSENYIKYEMKLDSKGQEISLDTTLKNMVAADTWISRERLDKEIIDKIGSFNEKASFIFVVPAKNNYCFILYFLTKDEYNNYYLMDKKVYAYEKEQLNCFFDGKH